MTADAARLAQLERRLARERQAREAAEAIAERGLRELFQRQSELELLEAIATTANRDLALEDVLRLALAEICTFSGWPVGHASLVVRDGAGVPIPCPVAHWRQDGVVAAAEPGRDIVARVIDRAGHVWIADRSAGEAAQDHGTATGLRSAFAFPVVTGTSVSAVMAFHGYAAADPDERLLRLAPQIAAQLGRAVERWTAAAALRDTHARLEVAIGNMAQGLSLFDAAQKLVLVNRRYRDMYALGDADVAHGLPAAALFGLHAPLFESADAAATLARLLSEASEDRPSSAELALCDGRVVAMRVNRTPAGGWVSTHLDVTDQHRAKAQIAHLALHDALTGLPNRTKLRDRLDDELATLRRNGGQLAVLCFDLDRFKAVNDTLGHAFGDLLLQRVAQRLQASVRETDLVSRLGGDEFAIIQPTSVQPADAHALADRIITELALPFDLDGHLVSVGASVGIAVAPDDAAGAEQLLKSADLALYRAKSDGRGTFRFFEPEMDARMRERRALELDLRRAISLGEFDVYYQPTVNLATRSVAGFEALARWNHPTRGLVSPAEFIPLAEEIGLIVPLGEFVLRRACVDAALWPGDLKVAVNLSPVQFVGAGPVRAVQQALDAAGLDPARLELEITETAMLAETETTLARLHELKALGVRIAMDDFGTGYSSLSYLRKFPFDRVKIDRSFVTALHEKSGDAIMQAITALCEALGMETTAEGVETSAQLDYLAFGPCTDVQGYLFSPPRPASEVVHLIEALRAESPPSLEIALGVAEAAPYRA